MQGAVRQLAWPGRGWAPARAPRRAGAASAAAALRVVGWLEQSSVLAS